MKKNYVTNKISYHASANKEYQLHNLVLDQQNLCLQLLKSGHRFYGHATEHHNCDHDIIEAWNKKWNKYQCPKQLTLTLDTPAPPGSDLPQKLWVTLNRLRAGVGQFGAEMQKDSEHQPHMHAELPLKMWSTSCFIAIFFIHLTPSRNLTNMTDNMKNWHSTSSRKHAMSPQTKEED